MFNQSHCDLTYYKISILIALAVKLSVFDWCRVCNWNMIDADRFIALSDSRHRLTCCVWQKIGSCVSCQKPGALFQLSGWDQTIKSWSWSLFPSWGWMYMTWFGRAPAQLTAVSQTFRKKKIHFTLYIFLYFFWNSTWILWIWLP